MIKQLLTVIFCGIFGTLAAQTLYVSPGGTGSGTSWTNAAGLQTALQTASAGTEIWVAAGTYTPVVCNPCAPFQREITFTVKSGVRLLGGFNGTETSAAQRDPAANPTVLSGDTDGDGTPENNAHTVLLTENVNAQTLIDGFTIRDGRADFDDEGDVSLRRRGGGFYNDGTGSGSSPTLRNCIFTDNYAVSKGGGFYSDALTGNTAVVFEECTFEGNVADLGGGGYSDGKQGDAQAEFRRCTFRENQAFSTAGAIYTFARDSGGAATSVFVNCLFQANFAESCGAVYGLGADEGTTLHTITNCTFYGNYAAVGGAVYMNASGGGICEATVSNDIFWGNFADFDDIFHYSGDSNPVIHLRNSLVSISNCDDLLFGEGEIDCQGDIFYNQDPQFVNESADDFRLQQTSPCINTGNNADINAFGASEDLDGALRIQSGTVDMGCFEFGGSTQIPLNITQQPQSQNGCDGFAVTFVTEATGTQPLSFQWQKNGANLPGENANTLTINDLDDSDEANYRCIITDALDESLTTQNAALNVLAIVEPEVSITADDLTVCTDESVTFTAFPVNGGTDGNPFYIWKVNDEDAEDEHTEVFTLENPQDGDVVRVGMISAAACAVPDFVLSDPLTIAVGADASLSVNISVSENEICAGETVTFTSEVSGGTDISYNWLLDGTAVATTPDFSTADLAPGNTVTLEVSTPGECVETLTAVSNPQSVSVQPLLTPQIDIQTAVGDVCAGETVTFSAIVQNAGDSPAYEWRVNGVFAATGGEFSTNELNNGDVVTCLLTASAECLTTETAESNALEMTVFPVAQPAINITGSATEVCEGGSVTFTAVIADGGSEPQITWFVNGMQFPTNETTFTAENITTFTSVQAQLETSAPCPAALFAFSETRQINVGTGIVPTVGITTDATDYCENEELTAAFTASTNFTPTTIIWLVNEEEVQNSADTEFILAGFGDGDVVSARAQSDDACLTAPEAESEEITLQVHPVPVVILTLFDTICHNAAPVMLTGGTPEGGSYTGDLVTDNVFDPTGAAAGFYEVVYTYTTENGCTDSDFTQTEVVICTSTERPEDIDAIVFPNPFTDNIYVQGVQILDVRITDAAGRAYFTPTDIYADGAVTAGSGLAPGIYFVRVFTEAGVKTFVTLKESN